MKKKLYFTVEKEVYSDGESLTGNKTVQVYEIINNEIKKFFSLDLLNDDDTRAEILSYLDDNGFGDDEFDLINL